MKIKYILLICALLVSSCNLNTSTTTEEPTVMPPTELPPTQAAPTATPAPIPSPTHSPILFRDEFDSSLTEGWSWQNEDPANWSLSAQPGWLEVTVLPGHIVTGNYSNLLLRPAPDGDFQIETLVEFEPVANFQFAGLIVYQTDAHFLQAGRAFCEGTDVCIGNGLYFDNYANNTFQNPNFATPYDGGATIHLRLQRQGDTYTFFSSVDGMDWNEIGKHQVGIEPHLIGLVAAQNNDGVPLPAHFDYFMVSEIQE